MAKYVVSACLLGRNCKYTGGNNFNSRVAAFVRGKEYIAICPELDGGLGVPRPPAEIVGGNGGDVLDGWAAVVTNDGADVSREFCQGAATAVAAARSLGAQAALLKERSPSCGVSQLYSGRFDGDVRRGRGVAAAALARAGIRLYSEENLPGEELMMDYAETAERIVLWLQEKVTGAGARGCVLGISGGIDSAVVAALCRRAFPDSTLGVFTSVNSEAADLEDAGLVAGVLGIKLMHVNLDHVFTDLVRAIEPDGLELGQDNLAVANVKPRLRMTVLYYLAARNNYLVVGTSNKSELVTGFFTKYGDGGVDLEPIGDLVKAQVMDLARYLQLPEKIINRKPSAGLWPGQTDEAELGFTYSQLDQFLLTGATDARAMEDIRAVMSRADHKLAPPPVCKL